MDQMNARHSALEYFRAVNDRVPCDEEDWTEVKALADFIWRGDTPKYPEDGASAV